VRPSVDPEPFPAPHAYTLYLRREAVARLEWRGREGWHLRLGEGRWRRLAVDADLDAALASVVADDLIADVSVALALDAAAQVLRGPSVRTGPPLPTGRYELHASGLTPDVLPLAFPETIAVMAGDVSVLAGTFDDRGLAVVTRRIALLGGRLLALFHADDTG
jgi:hypothetical protein